MSRNWGSASAATLAGSAEKNDADPAISHGLGTEFADDTLAYRMRHLEGKATNGP
jgi:hypothetical protein